MPTWNCKVNEADTGFTIEAHTPNEAMDKLKGWLLRDVQKTIDDEEKRRIKPKTYEVGQKYTAYLYVETPEAHRPGKRPLAYLLPYGLEAYFKIKSTLKTIYPEEVYGE